uniref:Uncharacterized protein n=1 Tax=Arundo donax TaxID=35708 RepID=A0A0A8YGN5_ARUDO
MCWVRLLFNLSFAKKCFFTLTMDLQVV